MNLHQISKIVVFAFSLLLLFVLPGCLFDHPPETEPPVATSALTLEYPDGSTQTNATQGETIKVKIKFKIGFNDDGKTILVSLSTAQQGLTFDGVTTPLSLHGAIGTVVTAEANVKVAANAVAGIRTIKAKVDDRSDDSAALLDVLDNLVSVTITPASSNIPLGGSKDYVLSILPRGGTVGPIVLTTAVQRAGVSVSPKTFAPVMLFHSLTPVLQTVTVSAATAALLGTGDLNISYHGEILGKAAYTVFDPGAGTPAFKITANKSVITAAMGVASESVHFTVSSVNGFYGNIYVVFTADGAMDIVPDDDHLNHAISPGHNYEFDRQFIRHATDPLPIHITYSASDVPFTVTHDVQITANLPTG